MPTVFNAVGGTGGGDGGEHERTRDRRRTASNASSPQRAARPHPISAEDGSPSSRRSSGGTPASLFPGFLSPFYLTRINERQDTELSTEAYESTPLTMMSHHFLLPPEDSVYSYFMFMPPLEQRRTKRYITPLICFAGVLVVVNFIMQMGLLLVVGNYIKNAHSDWVSGIVQIKKPAWYHIVPMPYNLPPPKCHSGASTLCIEKGDGISCASPSIHLLTNFDMLDTDGDGVWSRSEAANEQLRETVQCDYGVDLLTIYNSISQQLNASAMLNRRRDSDLSTGAGVNQAYFNWFLHKPLLCQYGDADICGPLLQRGFFDEALRQQSSPDFTDANSALKYCTKLLTQGCFDILPSSYQVWRSRSNQQCGERVFGQSMYTVPDSVRDGSAGDLVPVLTLGFKIQETYETTKGVGFRMFLCILLVTFLSVMFLEMRSINRVAAWTLQFPHDDEAGQGRHIVGKNAVRITYERKESSEPSDDDLEKEASTDKDTASSHGSERHFEFHARQKSIEKVRRDHRIIVGLVAVFRLLLWFFLLWSGIMFLTGQPRYLTLIFDALSLVFIFEIDELLYNTMLRHELKKDHLSIDDMRVPTLHGGLLSGKKTIHMDILCFIGIIVFALCIVRTYTMDELNPMIDALGCLCSKDGPRCYEAQHFSKSWWDKYWTTTLPAANLIIDRLKNI